MEAVNEGKNELAGIDIMLIIIINLVIHILSLIARVYYSAKCEKWVDNIHALQRLTNENKKNTQTQTEQLR